MLRELDTETKDALRLVVIILGGVVLLGIVLVLVAPLLGYYVRHIYKWLG